MKKRMLQIILLAFFGLGLLLLPGCDIFDMILQDLIDEALRNFFASLNPLNSPAGTSALAGVAAAGVAGIMAILLSAQSSLESAIEALAGSTSSETSEEEEDSSSSETKEEQATNPPGLNLTFDENGNVLYGDRWLTPEEALNRIKIDQEYLTAREQGQKLVDEYKANLAELQGMSPELQAQIERLEEIRSRLEAATDDATRKLIQDEFAQQARDLRDTMSGLKNSDDPAVRELMQRLEAQSAEMNANYSSKNILKSEGRTGTGAFFDGNVQEIYSQIDQAFVDKLNAMGFRRGGREFTVEDFKDYRNSASSGTVGMDRDKGLNEDDIRRLINELDKAVPGSPEAEKLVQELAAERARVKITVDPEQQVAYLRRELTAANSELERLRADLDKLPVGSPEAARIQSEIKRLTEVPAQLSREIGDIETRMDYIKDSYINKLQSQLARAAPGSLEAQQLTRQIAEAQTRLAGRGEIRVSTSNFNDSAQSTYNRVYSNTTGTDPDRASQTLTTKTSTEAYSDLPVIKGELPSQKYAEQTASVSRIKEIINDNLANTGKLTTGEAIQETARGYSKDMTTKIITQMSSDPNVDPAKLDMVKRLQAALEEIGSGRVLPGQADAVIQNAVPEIEGINLRQATRILDANYESSIKYQGTGSIEPSGIQVVSPTETTTPTSTVKPATTSPETVAPAPSKVQTAFNYTNLAANVEGCYNQNLAQGMTSGEALTVATVQTAAGAAEQISGLANPQLSMAAGAILPTGVNNVLPDQAIQNWVGTGYMANEAILDSVRTSIQSGQLDTTALDKFGAVVASREGADPFKGIGQAVELGTEEFYRSDGGSIITDLQTISQTGAGVDTINESMVEFQQSIAAAPAGNRNVVLQGLDHLTQSVSDVVVDPVYEARSLYNDAKNMINYGVDDSYWTDTYNDTKSVLKDTPLVGQVIKGYGELYDGVATQGVSGFGQEMLEGGAALAGEGVDMVASAASDGYNYIKSLF